MKIAELLGKSPVSPINEACGDCASTQAAYGIFDNGKASLVAIREPHVAATVKWMVGCFSPKGSMRRPGGWGRSAIATKRTTAA